MAQAPLIQQGLRLLFPGLATDFGLLPDLHLRMRLGQHSPERPHQELGTRQILFLVARHDSSKNRQLPYHDRTESPV